MNIRLNQLNLQWRFVYGTASEIDFYLIQLGTYMAGSGEYILHWVEEFDDGDSFRLHYFSNHKIIYK